MGFRCGIVGLPNVGKSTLFNALTATAAAATANYPFCTIDPNVGRVPVPDSRLDRIAAIAKSARIVPTQTEFVDIAGLVKGASRGEGLGNQFLGHIREVDAVVHLLRCFEEPDVTHVEGSVDPLRDAEIIETELMLADLESLERRLDATVKRARGGEADAKFELPLMERVAALLRDGKPARNLTPTAEDLAIFRRLQLLTAKPVLYVCNVDEGSAASGNDLTRNVARLAAAEGAGVAVISAKIEAELAQLADPTDRAAFLADLGLVEPGLNRVVRAGYELLGLLTFFTAGPKESRAWTVTQGATAPEAAGAIHTDFQRGFIAAEVIAHDDYIACNGEQGAKAAGKMRQEGRAYVVKDGDVILFRFNV
ncbi:MAG: redox-regulated ATPase YchF [Alphaproteobacteria bacterium]|nr:redox-regulated ATPase YchF [Alphaproteobacteria bacterium]